MQCEEVQELIYLQAVGAADQAALAAVQGHLAGGCLGCQAVMAEATLAAAQIPLSLSPCASSASLKAELMRRAKSGNATNEAEVSATDPNCKPAPRKILMWPLVISASMAAAFLLVAVMGLQANQQLTSERAMDTTVWQQLKASVAHDKTQIRLLSAEMHQAIAMEQNKISVLHAELKAARNVEEMIGSPALEMASLHGAAPVRFAWGRVMWNAKMKMWKLCAFNLPHLPRSKTYEVWMITAHGKKIPAGLFNTDDRTESIMMTPKVSANPHAMAEIAVTIEPAGGSPQPTGAVLLTGHIG